MLTLIRRRLSPILLLLLLSACGATPTVTLSPTAPAVPTVAPPTATSARTAAPPTATSAPTVVPSTATSAPTAAPPTATNAPTVVPPTATSAPTVAATVAAEVLFLRNGNLVAHNPAAGTERILADAVGDFAATPDGRRIALVRGSGVAAELWVIERDGSDLRRLTNNTRAEAGPDWAPDGSALVYTSAADPTRSLDWAGWSAWCAQAEVRLIELSTRDEQTLGSGCDPAFDPAGQRIAFATAPTQQPPGLDFLGSTNAIRMVNRAGANGWNYATGGPETTPMASYLVYAPAWSPASAELAYQRFVGYQALVDINMTELGPTFRGPGAPIGVGAGWLLPPRFAPDGRTVAVVEHNFGDARGFSGYDIWGVTLLRLGEAETAALPAAEITLNAATTAVLPRATAAAWSPDGNTLAVILPADWQPGRSAQEPAYPTEGPGAVWQWVPGSDPTMLLAPDVDFGSPLLWLPSIGA